MVNYAYWVDPATGTYVASREPVPHLAETGSNSRWAAVIPCGFLITVAVGRTTYLTNPIIWSVWGLVGQPPLRFGARDDGNGVTENHGRINTVRQEASSDNGNRVQFGGNGTYQ